MVDNGSVQSASKHAGMAVAEFLFQGIHLQCGRHLMQRGVGT